MADLEKIMGVSADDIEKIMGVSKSDIEKIIGVEIPSGLAWAGTRAVSAGGSNTAHGDLDRIQYKTIGASANTVDFGDLQTTRAQHSCGGSNSTRGIWGGGITQVGGADVYGVTDTDYITIASTGDGTDFGDMDQAASYGTNEGCSNGTLLFSNGGYTTAPAGTQDRIEYYTIASTGNGTDAGNLNAIKSTCGGSNGDSRYLVMGGYKNDSGNTDDIEYNDFSTSANGSDFGNLSGATLYVGSVNSTVRSAFAVPKNQYNLNTIEYVTVASTGNSSDFGDLSTERDQVSGTSDGTTGEFLEVAERAI